MSRTKDYEEATDWRAKVPPALADEGTLAKLSDPRFFLPRYGNVLDQESDTIIPFKSDICPTVQHSIMSYVAEPPRTVSGHTTFLALIGPRQCTKSTTAAGCLLPQVLYRPGTHGVTVADEQDRADLLFEHVMFNYSRLPAGVKMPPINTSAVRRLNAVHGGTYKALTSGYTGNTGLGRGIAWTHISEGPFHKDFASFWNKYYPAIANRKNAACILESTPGAMSEPSSPAYRDLMFEARQGIGRWKYVFAAFWESRLNERPWDKSWKMAPDEIALMELYGPKDGGPLSRPNDVRFLTLENLAFLREVRVMDQKIRKDPGLLWVFYPKDDVSCWHQTGSAAFPSHAMDSLLKRSGGPDSLVDWTPSDGMYMEFAEPRDDAVYVIGADPSGWGSGDPSSFQVFEVWSDCVEQVAEFESNQLTPQQFAELISKVAREFNDAEVFCESNGVGGATLAILELLHEQGKLKNLHYYAFGKPGVPNSTRRHNEALGHLVNMSLDLSQGGEDSLIIHSKNLQSQLATYRQDKMVEPGTKTLVLSNSPTGGRREKHHWDRVSAMLWALYGVPYQRMQTKPRVGVESQHMPHMGLHLDWKKRADERFKKAIGGGDGALIRPK